MKLAKLYNLTWRVAGKVFEKHQKYLDARREVFKSMIKPEYRRLIKWIDWEETDGHHT